MKKTPKNYYNVCPCSITQKLVKKENVIKDNKRIELQRKEINAA